MMKRFITASLTAFTLLSSASAHAFTDTDAEGDFFNEKSKVSDKELNKMRGGFITAGGLHLTFGITSRTIVDGNVEQNIAIKDFSNQNASIAELGKLVQIGPNNQALAQEVINNMPGLLTVIQNSLDEKVIQHFNIVDINVQNLDSFRQQIQAQNFDYRTAVLQ